MTQLAKFKTRLKMCALAGIRPWQVQDFWDGIEELKLKYCANCGTRLSKKTAKIAKIIKPNHILCKGCNPRPIRPF